MKKEPIIKAIIGTILTLIAMVAIAFGITLLDNAPNWVNRLLFSLAVMYAVVWLFRQFYEHFKEK